MKKKALQLASVASMIDQFTIPNIKILQSLGYQVDVVADFTNPGTITNERALDLRNRLKEIHVNVFDIAIPRSLNPNAIYSSYKAVRQLIKQEQYKIIHCHSPIGGAICRLAAKSERKNKCKVIYTAHGFHFYSGAPIKNWMVYYPIEKILSRYTDVLITINKDDYKLAKNKFNSLHTMYVPGIGVDIQKFTRLEIGRGKIRTELGIHDDQIMLLSVGELNVNKNHINVIRALKNLNNIVYVIVGKGDLHDELAQEADKYSIDLRLVGYRTDVVDFYSAADVFVLPSIREGLNVSLMEAMSSGLAATCGRIRGNIDLIKEPLFSPEKVDEIRKAVIEAIEHKEKLGSINKEKIKNFSTEIVNKKMINIYKNASNLKR